MANLRYLFEDYALDTERRELRRGDAPVAVEPKVFDLLAYLIENRERVVSRDDLIAHVWDGRIVSESALARCINAARSAIGDSGEAQRLIKTLPRKGLRFVGAVREETGTVRDRRRQPPGPRGQLPPWLCPTGRRSPCCRSTTSAATRTRTISPTASPRTSSPSCRGSPSCSSSPATPPSNTRARRSTCARSAASSACATSWRAAFAASGDRVRISAQLVDAVTGAHRWAERYDRQLEDVFAVQDEVARTIVAILAAHVNKAEIERTLNKPPETWQAYDYYLRAADTHASFLSSFKAAELYEVRRLLEQSLAIDPNYARAYARLAWTHLTAWLNSLDDDYLNPAALDRAYQLARKAVQLDPNLPQAHAALGHVLGRRREHEAAVAEFERAMALNPNFTDWRFARFSCYAGDPARAIEAVERHMRLDPFYVPLAPGLLGLAHYMLKQYSQALPLLRECVSRAPNLRGGHVWLAATYAQLGNIEEARAEAAEVLRIEPKWTIEGTQARLSAFKRTEDAEHFFDGLRKAGLPER